VTEGGIVVRRTVALLAAAVLVVGSAPASATPAETPRAVRSFTVTATLEPGEILVGQEATLSGSVRPVRRDTRVRIQRKKPSGWVTVARRSLDGDGLYQWAVSPARAGTYRYRARMPKVGRVRAGTSTARTLTVTEDPTVVFTIASGTGSGPWNSSDDPVLAEVGDTLRIVNGDSVAHRLHTDGTPFPHPETELAPGESEEYVLQEAFTGSLYCHVHGPGSTFWLTVTDPTA
jgi:hypothetical protein